MSWFTQAKLTGEETSERDRIARNIKRLEDLKSYVHNLGHLALSSQVKAYRVLFEMLRTNLVTGRRPVYQKLREAFIGDHRQKVALDGPRRFRKVMHEAEAMIENEIIAEIRHLQSIGDDDLPVSTVKGLQSK